ncbi:MAG: TIGR04076 family protein [Candidatus Heimdallarchaeota archaeon]|nr:MAG: TIGR04076 family protein [Candidatus Heimdallarchaeota archaeon]
MSIEISNCKITVIKRTIDQDLINEYIAEEYRDHMKPCEIFTDKQEFILEGEAAFQGPPPDFCASAWADIRKDIFTIAVGGDMPGLKQRGFTIAGCQDWFRPVIFKIERINKSK